MVFCVRLDGFRIYFIKYLGKNFLQPEMCIRDRSPTTPKPVFNIICAMSYSPVKIAAPIPIMYIKMLTRLDVYKRQVIYGASKTKEQMGGIINSLLSHCKENILITRLSTESAADVYKRQVRMRLSLFLLIS